MRPKRLLARVLRAVWVWFCGEPEPDRPATLPMRDRSPATAVLPQRSFDPHEEDDAPPDVIPMPLPPLQGFPRIWRPKDWS